MAVEPQAATVLSGRSRAAGQVLAEPRIRVSGLTKTYVRRSGEPVLAIDDVALDVSQGEFLVLLGPSGCGKTTLLRAIAGLENVVSGRIALDGVPVVDCDSGVNVPPEKRPVSMMFQSYALWPHMTVFDNVAYPLTTQKARRDDRGRQKIGRSEREERVNQMLSLVGISDLATQYPSQISGGQQQRVALARALVGGEGIVLFDEPLSNVDAKVRDHLRGELLKLHRELQFTAVYVTHDQEDAVTLASRIAVLRGGRIAQVGTPREIYDHPNSGYVARFMGAGNEFAGRIDRHVAGQAHLATPAGELIGRLPDASDSASGEVTVFTRPEKWTLSNEPRDVPNCREGCVESGSFLGFYTDYQVRVQGATVTVRRLSGADTAVLSAGTRVWVSIDPADVIVIRETVSPLQ